MRISKEIREQVKKDYATGNHTHRSLEAKYGFSRTSIARILNPDYRERERVASRMRQKNYEQPKPAYMLNLRFYDKDQELIDKLKAVSNKQQYVRDLIAADIKEDS